MCLGLCAEPPLCASLSRTADTTVWACPAGVLALTRSRSTPSPPLLILKLLSSLCGPHLRFRSLLFSSLGADPPARAASAAGIKPGPLARIPAHDYGQGSNALVPKRGSVASLPQARAPRRHGVSPNMPEKPVPPTGTRSRMDRSQAGVSGRGPPATERKAGDHTRRGGRVQRPRADRLVGCHWQWRMR